MFTLFFFLRITIRGKDVVDTLVPESVFLANNPDVTAPEESAPPEQHSEYLRRRLEYDMKERKRLVTEREDLTERKRACLDVAENGEKFLESLEDVAANMKKQLPTLCSSLALPSSLIPEPASRIPDLVHLRTVLERACTALNNGATLVATTHAIKGYTSLLPKVDEDMFAARCCVVLSLPIEKDEHRDITFRYVRSTKGQSFITVQPEGATGAAQCAILDDLLGSGKNCKKLNAVVARFAESDKVNATTVQMTTPDLDKIPFATAYAWAQKLGEKGNSEDLQQHAIRCVAALKERSDALFELSKHLSHLRHGIVPAPPSSPLDVRSAVSLSKWSETSSLPDTVVGFFHCSSSTLSLNEPYSGASNRFFRAVFAMGSVNVTSYFGINSAYPHVPCRVWLEKPQCEKQAIKLSPFYDSMERDVLATVNTLGLTPSTVSACKTSIVVAQIRYLQFALNILLCEATDIKQSSTPHTPSHLFSGREHAILMPHYLPLSFF